MELENDAAYVAQGLWMMAMREAELYCEQAGLSPDPIQLQHAMQETSSPFIIRVYEHRLQVVKGEIPKDKGFHIFHNIVKSFARNCVDRAVKVPSK